MTNIDVYKLLDQKERRIVNEIISEVIAREYGQKGLDGFDYDIKGVILDLEEDEEPTDLQMMQAYGTKWHDGL